MAENSTKIIISAEDRTRAAFASATSGLGGLSRAAISANSAISAIGIGVSVGAFVAFVKNTIDGADALNDMSLRTGVAVKTLAEYNLVAEQSGTSLEALGKGIQKLTLSIGQAEQGSGEQAEALKRLGVSARDPQAAFEQLADAVSKSNDPIKTNADLQKVLGKNYAELLPLLQAGSQGLRDSAIASSTFANAMEKLAPDADKFNDQLSTLKINVAGAAASIISNLVPSLNEYIAVGREVLNTGSLLDKIRFFALGNASDEMVGRVRASAAAAEAAAKKVKRAVGEIEQTKPKSTKTPKTQKAADPLAGLLGQTEQAKLAEYNKTLALLDARYAANKIGAHQYTEALLILNEQLDKSLGFGANLDDASIKEYQQRLASLISDTTIVKTQKFQADIDFLNQAFFDGALDAELYAQSIDKLTGSDLPENLKETNDIARELGMTFTSAFEDAIVGGKDLSEVLNGLEQDIMRIVTRKLVTEPLGNALSSAIGGSGGGDIFSTVASWLGFADGGVMTSAGSMPLRKYAGGGIANSPQLAVFGEGSQPEAYVPLPDGRRIPVAMSGGGGGMSVVNHFAISGPTDKRSQGQIAASVYSGIMRAARRNS
ncbi:hypothetical protein [Malikia spinosa]|uniref:hypothetical protein n=1 Tax=Malikia spinosa TaxID=86180 RepID=UPI002FDA92CA